MKKLAVILSLLLVLVQGSLARAAVSEADYYCAKEPYNLSKGLGSFFTSVTGTNFLATQIAEREIAKAMQKELGAKFKVNIDTFGGSNLINGKFKKLSAASKSIEKDGLYFSDVNLETLCGFNQVKYEDKQLYFVENMVLKYQGKITKEDLKKTINSTDYLKYLEKLSVSAGGTVVAKVTNTDITIANNKIVMSYDFMAPMWFGSIPKKISFSTGLDVENGKIKFDNIDFGNPITNLAMKSALPMINKLNPLVYQIKADKKTNAIVNVKNIKIINNEILADGIIILPKNYNQK